MKEIDFKKIVNTFETIADRITYIKAFHCGFLDEVDINKLEPNGYPLLYIEPGDSVIDVGTMTYTFTLYIMEQTLNQEITERADMLEESSDGIIHERTARNDSFNTTLLALKDVVAIFRQNLSSVNEVQTGDDAGKPIVPTEIILDLPVSASPFTARFDNLLTGWSMDITVLVNNTNNLCITPWYTGDDL